MIAQAEILDPGRTAHDALPAAGAGSGRPRPFSLLRSFSLRALLSILLIWGATSLLVTRFVEQELVDRDALVLQQLVLEIARRHDPAGYFTGRPTADAAALNDYFTGILALPDVGRINTYSADGTLIWSTDAGTRPPADARGSALESALAGRQSRERIDFDQARLSDLHPAATGVGWVVRHYIPVTDADTGRVYGVIALYRIPILLERAFREVRWLIWLCELGGGLFLYLMLFRIVSRADRLLAGQQRALLAQARLATIGEMASSVAHGIRNPVASIRSSAELALEESPSEEVAGNLEDIVAETERFDGWIRELLTFAADPVEMNGESDPSRIIDAAVEAVGNSAQRQAVDISVSVESNLPTVRGDARVLTQVLQSLFANALDAMPDGGELIVAACAAESAVRLTVTDTGFGIPSDKLDGLFDPLTSHKQGGVGIGLALARQVVERQGGHIVLHSALGVGTNVVLDLALAAPLDRPGSGP